MKKIKRSMEALESAKKTLEAEVAALAHLKGTLDDNFMAAVKSLSTCRGIIVTTGVGKSSFVAMKMAATFSSFGVRSHFMHPTEALHGDSGSVSPDDAVIAFSYSGASHEIIKMVKHLKHLGISATAITRDNDSGLAKASDRVIKLPSLKEGSPHGMAPMASVLASLALADSIVTAVVVFRGIHPDKFDKGHPGGGLGLMSRSAGELMTKGKDTPLLRKGASLRDVLEFITRKNLGVVGISDSKGKLIGVITDGDIRRFFMTHDSVWGVTAEDAMSKNPKTVLVTASLKEALETMEKYKITSLFVLDAKKRVVGLLHIHEIIGETSPSGRQKV